MTYINKLINIGKYFDVKWVIFTHALISHSATAISHNATGKKLWDYYNRKKSYIEDVKQNKLNILISATISIVFPQMC